MKKKSDKVTYKGTDYGIMYFDFVFLLKNSNLVKKNILISLNLKPLLKNITLYKTGLQLDSTLDGDPCQNWNSNEVHHEGSIFNFMTKNPKFRKEGKIFDDLDLHERQYIKDGLLDYEIIQEKQESGPGQEGKPEVLLWKTHNKCRNPGNRMPGPWCYTKNPNKRWAYCAKPDYGNVIARIVLLVTVFMFIIISYLLVKVIFKYEYFTIFMAKLTGSSAKNVEGGIATPSE